MARKKQIPYTREELFASGSPHIYTGRSLDEIAFPLGGIGTGSVSLGGWGQLRDWEIMNRPAKGRTMPNAFFCVRVVEPGEAPAVKTLQGPAGGTHRNGGHSAHRDSGEGLPHFRECVFRGEYPVAEVELSDSDFPVSAKLVAFNPFVPLDAEASGLPMAVLLYTITNHSSTPLKVSVMGNLTNIVGEEEGRVNASRKSDALQGLLLSTRKYAKDHPRYGEIVLATPAEDSWVWPQWHDSRILKFWEAVAWSEQWPPKRHGSSTSGTVGADFELEPGRSVTVLFLLTWYFPNYEYWSKADDAEHGPTWRNWYATRWQSAWEVARYAWHNFDRLLGDTRLFHQVLFSSTLPTHVLDAVSSQISILKTTTCLRLEDGTFYGFEGCGDTYGCCEGSCTHVWNYAQALPYLFPDLQRSMREADWANSMLDDGFVCFRMPLPLGTKGTDRFHPAADGQMGTVIQVYREWLICGDDEWLRRLWPKARQALEFAWKYWDTNRDGVMEGMQHNTYDIEFYGANTMVGSLYLAALRAAEEMARHLGEDGVADEYHRIFEHGSRFSDERLFNGEYYEQIVNPRAYEPWPAHLREMSAAYGKDDRFPSWPKWQFGKGCLSDQLLGQWYADMLGLGSLYRRANVLQTLQSIFRYNWRADLTDHFCSLRVYALNEEAGLLIASWPRGERPGYAFWFSDEVWCGIEYQVASHLIYRGLVEEGLAIVKGVRDRYTGERRNPWDEFECGHHYSRSLASYALLTALSGFSYSAPERRMGFAPRVSADDFRVFFSVASGWGTYAQRLDERGAALSLAVARGSLELRELTAAIEVVGRVSARVGNRRVKAEAERTDEGVRVRFSEPVTIREGEALRVRLSE